MHDRHQVPTIVQDVANVASDVSVARGTAESTRDTFKTLREINSVGVKIDPDQNKVSA